MPLPYLRLDSRPHFLTFIGGERYNTPRMNDINREPAVRVLVWNEFRHERTEGAACTVYPHGIHTAIADGLQARGGVAVRTATQDEPEHGLTEEVVAATDVLIWWGHIAQQDVRDDVVARVQRRVLEGMGMILLHASLGAKIFKALLGTSGTHTWREAGEKERLWNVAPAHPITHGIGAYFELPRTEMYGEYFDIPAPEALIFIPWFAGGEVFRSGCCWPRGYGRIFYFAPGHETFPIYYDEHVRTVLWNAVQWARPRLIAPLASRNVPPCEPLTGAPAA